MPVFLFVVFYNPGASAGLILGMVIFIVAGLTDLLDGYIARKYKMITAWGKLMDPLADKLMLVTVLITLTLKQLIPPFIVIVVIVKEILLIAGATFLYKSKNIVVQANYFGKVASAAFFLAVVAVIFDFPFSFHLMFMALLSTLIAFGQYFYTALMKNRKD